MFQRLAEERLSRSRATAAALFALHCVLVTALPSASLAAQPVRAGIYQNEPKIFFSDDGEPAGFFVDLLDAIAKSEGWEIQYFPCSWVECLLRLERGELDLMADVAHTSDREKRFDFGGEVVFASWSVIYAKSNHDIESVVDLNKKKVVVLRDSVQFHVLKEFTKSFDVSPRFIEVSSFEEGYQLVEDGEADCVAVNRFYGKLHESTHSLRSTNILIAPALVKFATSKQNDRVLLDAIDRHLPLLKNDSNSAYYQAFNHWFEPSKKISLPHWLKWALIGIGVVILGLVCLTFIFRRIVRHRTLELEHSKDHLEHLSYFDPVTGLPNRVLFTDRLEQAARQTRHSAPSLAVLFIDLDEFKQINDSVGHEVGDKVLKLVAERFTASIRKEDTVARLGGDEFTVLIQSPQDSKHVATIAEQLLGALHEPFQISQHSFYLTASVGISLLPEDGTDAQELLRNADAAMYSAKEEGRNTFRFYRQEMTVHAMERISLVAGLREGLEKNEFFLHFQPIFDLESRRTIGVEALARWKHGPSGLIPPDKFIPLAEESGVIFAIGARVLQEACAQMVEWRRDGIAPERIAVNLSGKQIQRGDIVKTVTSILEETSCLASWLELEVTEGFIMDTPDLSIPAIQGLRNMGIAVAIDDFGTGYSSLAYLKKLPISKLKIDRSFVRDIPSDPNDTAIARAVIALGESLGLTVLAEGIETEDQYNFLKREGCTEGQGYLLGPPVTAREMSELLALNASVMGEERTHKREVRRLNPNVYSSR